MADIFDGLDRAPEQQIAGLVAIYDTYNPFTQVKVFFKKIGNFFKWMFKMYYRPAGMACEFENRRTELSRISKEDLLNLLKKRMQKAVLLTGNYSGGRSDNRLSVCTINALTTIYRGSQYRFMSPCEKADEIKRKCYLRNSNIIKHLPLIWMILSVVILIGSIIFGVAFYPWKYVLPIGLGMEVVFYLLFKRKLAFEKLSRTMAVSGRFLGQIFSVPVDQLSIRRKENGEKFEKGLRALHSIASNVQENGQKQKELEMDKKEFGDSLQQVEGALRKYSDDKIKKELDISDLKNIEKELLLDRDRLKDEITQAEHTISDLIKLQDKENSFAKSLGSKLIPDIVKYWSERYGMFKFEDTFFTKLVQNFEWHSFEIIEKRLIELACMDDPTAIGKKRAKSYKLCFGIRGKLCAVIYSLKGKYISVFDLERENPVSDVGMSENEIHDTLDLYNIVWNENPGSEQAINVVIEELRHYQSAFDNALIERDKAMLEKQTAIVEKRNAQKELKKCQIAIEKLKDSKKYDEEKKKQFISELEEKIRKYEIEIKEKDKQYQDAVNTVEGQNGIIEEAEKKLEKALLNIKQLKDKRKKDKERYEKKIQLLKTDLEQEKNNVDIFKNQLAGLRANNADPGLRNSLEGKIKVLEKLVLEKEQEYNDLLDEKNQADEKIAEIETLYNESLDSKEDYKKKYQQAIQENEAITKRVSENSVFIDASIRRQFLDAFKNAKNEIDIICPWIASMAESEEFRECLEKAVLNGVTVKIRYGLDEKSGNDKHKGVSKEAIRVINKNGIKTESDELRTLRNINAMHRTFEKIRPGCIKSKQSNTHGKLFIVDDEYFMIGSFNFLSFEGRYRINDRDKRTEIALKSTDKNVLMEYRNKFFNFNNNSPEWITENLGDPYIWK